MKPYLSIAQSWGIFGIAIFSMLIFIPVNMEITKLLGAEIGMFVYYGLSMSTTAILAHLLRKKKTGEVSYPLKGGPMTTFLLLIISILGLQLGITMPLGSLIPMPEFVQEMFLQLSSYNGLFGFLTIVIAAPVLEELIFRGIILEGLLKRYSPLKSILFSSFLFGLVHLNPWQLISAMMIGSFSGWVYYRSRNLNYSIFIHFINNLIPFIAMFFYSAEDLMLMEMDEVFGGTVNAAIAIVVSLAFAAFGIRLLDLRLKLINS